jgi:hypothetical protein
MTHGSMHVGSYGTAIVKPNSITRWARDGSSLLKIYRNIAPHERRRRELDALHIAAGWGLSVPPVVATSEQDDHAWTVFGTVPGSPCSIRTDREVRDFVQHTIEVTRQVHREIDAAHTGPGWQWHGEPRGSNRDYLLDQLSSRCRKLPWWRDLESALAPCDGLPTVYLHGDLKPEHLLVDGCRLYVVDWEASGRGPAVSDQADAIFHVIRDLIYTSVTPCRVAFDVVGQLGAVGPALAWRLVLWLDRRRSGDIHLMAARDLRQLAREDDPVAACERLAWLVLRLRAAGVPR